MALLSNSCEGARGSHLEVALETKVIGMKKCAALLLGQLGVPPEVQNVNGALQKQQAALSSPG